LGLGQKPGIIVKIEIKADREAKREDGGKCGPGAVVPRAQCVAEIRVLGSIVLDQGPGRCGRQDAWSLGRLTISLDEQIRKARNKSKKKTTSRTEKRREENSREAASLSGCMGDHLRCITGGALGQRAATATRFLQGDWRPTAERFLVGLGVQASAACVLCP